VAVLLGRKGIEHHAAVGELEHHVLLRRDGGPFHLGEGKARCGKRTLRKIVMKIYVRERIFKGLKYKETKVSRYYEIK